MAFNCYITFPTIFYAIRAEELLNKEGFEFKMVPVPRSISSSCGTALRSSCDALNHLRKLLTGKNVELEGFYRLEEVGFKTSSVEELFFND
jgi:hypothetical protein